MTRSFTFGGLPMRVLFGHGTVDQVGAEAGLLGMRRALVLSTLEQRDQAEQVARLLGDRHAASFDGAVMHTPVEVTERALGFARELEVDGLVAVGGGSTTGLGKAIALRTDLPQIVIPTTYAGSEMTPILGQTENGLKTTQRTPKVLPETTIYDVSLTLGLPVRLSATSGLNAIAHAVEALYAPDANPIISLLSREAIRALARALPVVVASPGDVDARADALYGAWLCGVALGAVGMGLHHKLCHTLGGSFDLPHAETHAVVLPHALAYNAGAAPVAARQVAEALGVADAAAGLHGLALRLGAPTTLVSLGLRESDLDRAADLATQAAYPNPRPLARDAIRALLDDAFHGRAPSGTATREQAA